MKNRIVVVTLTAAVVLILPGCGVGEAKVANATTGETTAPLPVDIAKPRTTDLYATYRTTAALAADAAAGVPARISGEVVEILVEEGERVEAGQVLARLDGERARLEMLQAKANLEMATREYERSLRLREQGLVSASAFESLQYDVDALRATWELKRLNYDYTAIRATIAGVVTKRAIKLGWRVNAGDPTFRIADISRLVAEMHIPQNDLARFSVGLDAAILVDALPHREFSATIARISPTIDVRDGTFRATAYIDNRDGLLAPGMFCRFSIAYEKHADALVIPSSAVVSEDNEDVVYVVEDGAATRRQVKVGIESNGMTEILDGLDKSESVVVTGQGSLRNGSRVFASNAAAITG